MKKVAIPLLLLLVSVISFALPQKKKVKKARQKDAITKIEYETFTRGNRSEVRITKDSAISIGRSEKKFILITEAKWNTVCAALKNVTLSAVPALEAPTKAREYDGAAHCKIIISGKSVSYESKYFDGGHPMKELKQLYDVIESIRTEIKDEGKTYVQ